MFDGIINNAKGSLNMMVMFFVAGLVGMTIGTLVDGAPFDFMVIVTFAVKAAIAGFATALVMGAAKG